LNSPGHPSASRSRRSPARIRMSVLSAPLNTSPVAAPSNCAFRNTRSRSRTFLIQMGRHGRGAFQRVAGVARHLQRLLILRIRHDRFQLELTVRYRPPSRFLPPNTSSHPIAEPPAPTGTAMPPRWRTGSQGYAASVPKRARPTVTVAAALISPPRVHDPCKRAAIEQPPARSGRSEGAEDGKTPGQDGCAARDLNPEPAD
jgi:hypothetical protein